MKTSSITPLVLLLAILTPFIAQAHPGHPPAGLGQGFVHPLTGLDHLLAMFAVGLWAAQIGGRARYYVPIAFVVTMILGGVLGMGRVPIPWVEQGIVASVFVLGLLIALATRPKLAVTIQVVATFALFHGHAHGTEMVSGSSGLAYALGFAGATALLHAAGIGLGLFLNHKAEDTWLRAAGAGIAFSGIVLAFN